MVVAREITTDAFKALPCSWLYGFSFMRIWSAQRAWTSDKAPVPGVDSRRYIVRSWCVCVWWRGVRRVETVTVLAKNKISRRRRRRGKNDDPALVLWERATAAFNDFPPDILSLLFSFARPSIPIAVVPAVNKRAPH